jgi:hypothetical protein
MKVSRFAFPKQGEKNDACIDTPVLPSERQPMLPDHVAAVFHYLDVAAYVIFRLWLLASFILILYRLLVKEWRKR